MIPAVAPGLGTGRQIVSLENKSQCAILLGFPGISMANPDYYAMLILNHVLGQAGLGGRIGNRVRDQEGLAYYANSTFEASLAEGPFAVHAGVNPKNVDRAIALILEEIERIKKDAISLGEIQEAKRFLINSLPLELETNAGIVRQMIRSEFFQLGDNYLARFPELIEAVTMDKMIDCWRLHMSFEKAALIIVGPYPPKDQ
jgi:zinc protease